MGKFHPPEIYPFLFTNFVKEIKLGNRGMRNDRVMPNRTQWDGESDMYFGKFWLSLSAFN